MESPFGHPGPVRQRKAHQEVEQRHRAVDGEGLEGGGRGELPLAREFDEPDGRREGGVLDELDQEAHGRRHRDPDGLRDDDVAELVRRAEAEGGAGLPLRLRDRLQGAAPDLAEKGAGVDRERQGRTDPGVDRQPDRKSTRSEEHTSELQSLMRNSYAVFCLKKKTVKMLTWS